MVSKGTKIWVSMPDKLLAELDHLASCAGMSRADAVVRAVETFVVRTSVEGLKMALERGYRDMADLNLAIVHGDEETLADMGEFERKFSEADTSGGF